MRQTLQTILKATKLGKIGKIRLNKCKMFKRGKIALSVALMQMWTHLSPQPTKILNRQWCLSPQTTKTINSKRLKHLLRSSCRSSRCCHSLTKSPHISRKKRQKFVRIGKGTHANLVNPVPTHTVLPNYLRKSMWNHNSERRSAKSFWKDTVRMAEGASSRILTLIWQISRRKRLLIRICCTRIHR